MKEKNYTGIIGSAVPKFALCRETFNKEVINNIDLKKVLWSMLHIGGFLFVASILFVLVMLIATS